MSPSEHLDPMDRRAIAEDREPAGQRDARPLTIPTITAVAAADVPEVIEPLFREYGRWVAEQLAHDARITLTPADQDRHHAAFRAELPRLLGPRGRLLVAHLGGDPAGVGALKPVDDTTAEIKRMFVRPGARGLGIGRALLQRLVDDARHEQYTTVRLETLRFMTTALAMYRRFGFVETPTFHGSETADTALDPLTIAMELRLGGADGAKP